MLNESRPRVTVDRLPLEIEWSNGKRAADNYESCQHLGEAGAASDFEEREREKEKHEQNLDLLSPDHNAAVICVSVAGVLQQAQRH